MTPAETPLHTWRATRVDDDTEDDDYEEEYEFDIPFEVF